MNLIFQNIDKENLHHAYLIEGDRDLVLPEIHSFMKDLGVDIANNGDFSHIMVDVFKVEDARNLKSFSGEKSSKEGKRIFVISANNFLLEAQNSLLKIFEEPIPETHFFVIVPDKNILIDTLASRFYVLSKKMIGEADLKNAEKFLKMNLPLRLEFVKEMLALTDEEEDDKIITQNSARARALSFINALEVVLGRNLVNNFSGFTLPGVPVGTHTVQNFSPDYLQHIMKVRGFLRMPGASAKNLMESVALIVPNL